MMSRPLRVRHRTTTSACSAPLSGPKDTLQDIETEGQDKNVKTLGMLNSLETSTHLRQYMSLTLFYFEWVVLYTVRTHVPIANPRAVVLILFSCINRSKDCSGRYDSKLLDWFRAFWISSRGIGYDLFYVMYCCNDNLLSSSCPIICPSYVLIS